MQVQKDLVPRFLIQERELLRQFYLYRRRARPLLVDTAMENFVALDRRQSLYQNAFYDFPTGL